MRAAILAGGRWRTQDHEYHPVSDIHPQENRATAETASHSALLRCSHAPLMAAFHCRTYTAPSARGKGVAGKLADAAFTFAHEHSLAVRPTCSYIADAYIPGGKGAAASFAFDAGSGLALPK